MEARTESRVLSGVICLFQDVSRKVEQLFLSRAEPP